MEHDDGERYIETSRTRNTPIIQGDSDLIFAFSEPEAKDYDSEFKHISRDTRMANTDTLDFNYLNIASPLSRAVDDLLGHNSNFGKMLKHDMFMLNNMSVGRAGFGMKTLVTRKQEQKARIVQDSGGFFKKEPKEGTYG